MSFDRFAVVRVPFPFIDRDAAKNRPAFVLSDSVEPKFSISLWDIKNQGVVGRVLTRHVGLKPDLRSNGKSGLNSTLQQGTRLWP